MEECNEVLSVYETNWPSKRQLWNSLRCQFTLYQITIEFQVLFADLIGRSSQKWATVADHLHKCTNFEFGEVCSKSLRAYFEIQSSLFTSANWSQIVTNLIHFMTMFGHQKNSTLHYLLEAFTLSLILDFCWMKSVNTFNIQTRSGTISALHEITRPCEQGNWDTWMVLDPWNQV